MKNKFGFTLIELLVAITIGILIVGLGSLALNDFNEKQKVQAVSQELVANLRLARNYAVTQQLPNGGNRVAVTISASGLMTANSLDSSDVGSSNLFTKNLNVKGISINTTPGTIRFSVADGRSFAISGTNLIGTTATIVVSNSTGNSKTIKIDQSGLIYEE